MPLASGLFTRRRKEAPPPSEQEPELVPVVEASAPSTPAILKWSYQTALRAVGRHADDSGLRAVSIMEVRGGFLLSAHSGPEPTLVIGTEITAEDMDALIVKNFTAMTRQEELLYRSPLCPTGYEDWFRALGLRLDEEQVRAVALSELTDGFAVTFLRSNKDGDQTWEFGGLRLGKEEIQNLLDTAYLRRGKVDGEDS